ncbi:SMI1/KNR4 family protein [Metabacillus litoralis]|uniref:SMI1/KNR4 family protein n=1 Tax=Metabacillus litoralis TaxID=152268 RepID=UPI001CFCD194|nr:SMI1/KNR4 family protein [Metabacillus litoralis]
MNDITYLLLKWDQILQRLKNNNGVVHHIEIGKKASIQEIEAKEKELGYQLPESFKYILKNLGTSLSFYYSFSEDTIIPSEFNQISSGEINWNIDFLQNLDLLADELMEDGEDYAVTLRGKLEFSHTGNGDIYAFDMSVESDEKPVIYWDHEEDTVTYIAESFIDYLFKITELGCIGSEKWQLEYFLIESGLDTTSPVAAKWKDWFESFSETTLNDVRNSMKQLIDFTVYRERLDEKSIEFLGKFNRKNIFDYLLVELDKKEGYIKQKIICEVIGRVLGNDAESWVRSLWEANQDILDPRLRSFLTSMCINRATGLSLVFNFLEQQSNKKITGYEALSHLGDFHSSDVILWMEEHIQFPVTEGWDELFISSNFSWKEIERWTSLEEKHEVTVIHALENYVQEKVATNNFQPVISDLPTKSNFLDFLVKLRSKQVLKRRILPLDNVIQNINIFY